MVRGNPALDQLEELPGFRDNLFGFGVRRDGSMVVVDHIALAPAGFEEIKQACGGSSKRQPCGLERQTVMAGRGNEPVPSTGDGHCCRLQGGIICGGKPAIVGQLLDGGIFQVAKDDCPQIVQFLLTSLVRVDFAFGLQLFPTHSENPQW